MAFALARLFYASAPFLHLYVLKNAVEHETYIRKASDDLSVSPPSAFVSPSRSVLLYAAVIVDLS